MKSHSSVTIYSDNTCPFCGGEIGYSDLYQHFFALCCSTNFEYACPHCKKVFSVEAELIPSFHIERANNPLNPTAENAAG